MSTPQQRSERSSLATCTPSGAPLDRPDEAVSLGARRLVEALAEPARRGRDQWLAIVGDCQWLINTLTAVQDTAIAEAARRESSWCEDGTLGETVHAPGQVTLDAADVVAPAIGASHPQAQRRVEQAVRLATGRVPVPAEARDLPQASGLGGLHQAMAAGQLDGYRAGVIAFELEAAPAAVADAIVTALAGHLGDDATTLRRRTRVLLHRICPELLRERAKQARAATGLRRWVAEPGVDEWHGTFPTEDAAAAWAAIDRLAHDLVTTGTCTNIEQARGKALTDLVTGNATIDVQVMLTVPAATDSAHTVAPNTVAASTSSAPQHADPTSGDHPLEIATTSASQRDAAGVESSQGPTTADHHAAADHQDPPTAGVNDAHPLTTSVPDVPRMPADSVRPCSHDDDLVEVQGARPSEPLLVRRGWLRDHLSKAPPRPRQGAQRARPLFVPCDPLTGARLDPDENLASDAYRPSAELAALIRARDGRCRFPGCSVAARFCDLDHVRPWPTGRTTARNLLTLCRRHHRIKQRPGWQLRLAPDGTATWADPSGRERTTVPLNALHSLVLRVDPADDRLQAGAGELMAPVETHTGGERQAWSALETYLGLRLEHHPTGPGNDLGTNPTHRRCTSAAGLRAGSARRPAPVPFPDLPPF